MIKKNEKQQNHRCMYGLIAVILFALTGCMPGSSNISTVPLDTNGALPIMGSKHGTYEDIEIPAEMEYNPKGSMSIKTDSFRGGIIHYKGRVEMHSLKEFLVASMKKNKWKLAGEVSSQNVILAFTKPSKTCMINIDPKGSLSDTTLTMYVTVDVTGARALNAFGEPIE